MSYELTLLAGIPVSERNNEVYFMQQAKIELSVTPKNGAISGLDFNYNANASLKNTPFYDIYWINEDTKHTADAYGEIPRLMRVDDVLTALVADNEAEKNSRLEWAIAMLRAMLVSNETAGNETMVLLIGH